MKLKLKWINRNTDEDGTRVFRSDTPITTVEGLTAIATLPQGSSEYEDDVIQGKTYYYLLQSFRDGDDYTSQPITVFASPYSGAGSQELKMGDYGRGYFGLVDGSSFITTAEILDRLEFTGGSNVTGSINWYKFAFNGQIYFLSEKEAKYTTWNNLYSQGLVFGVDGPGSIIEGIEPVNQNRTITVDGDTYQVMIPKGFNEGIDWADVEFGLGKPNPECQGSLWNNTILAISSVMNDEVNKGKFDFINTSIVGFATELMQEISPAGTIHCRHASGERASTTRAANGRWRIVLRLVA